MIVFCRECGAQDEEEPGSDPLECCGQMMDTLDELEWSNDEGGEG